MKEGEQGAGFEVLFGDVVAEEGDARRTNGFDEAALQAAVEFGEDFVADLGLDGDEIEGSDADGAAGADALAVDVEQLPAEVEAALRTEEAAGEDEVDDELLAEAVGGRAGWWRRSSGRWLGGRQVRALLPGAQRERRRGRSRRSAWCRDRDRAARG